MEEGILALLIPFAGIGLAAFAVFLKHQRTLAEIQARGGIGVGNANGNVSADVRAELQALRQEVERLRDTSTKFDLSFDAGLTRLEERVERTEKDSASVSSSLSAVLMRLEEREYAARGIVGAPAKEETVQRVGAGR